MTIGVEPLCRFTIIESIFTYAQAHKDEIAAANGLADLVFKIGGAAVGGVTVAGGGLLALLKWMKGRKPDRIEEKGGDVIVHIGDTYFITNLQTIKLAESANVRSHARKMVASLEKRESRASRHANQGRRACLRKERYSIFRCARE
nr:hypothetical protein [Marinicella sp. W31]MDC2880115.1 hypothetical protein [Marinicella sp. W31]